MTDLQVRQLTYSTRTVMISYQWRSSPTQNFWLRPW